jgi:hypothetical protein
VTFGASEMTDTNTTILLDIYQRLGSIEAKLENSAGENDDRRTDTESLELRVANLEKFEARVGAYIWIGGTFVSGALFLLWEGLAYLIPWLKMKL